MNLGLHTRIALLYVTATGILAGILLIVIYMVVSRTVYSHLDNDLDAEVLEVFHGIVVLSDGFVFANPSEWQEGEHGAVEVNPVFIQVFDSLGNVLRSSPNLRKARLPFDPRLRLKHYQMSTFGGAPVRLVQMPVTNPQGGVLGSIVIAVPSQEAEVVLQNLRITLVIAFPVVLAILFVVSNVLAVRSIAPVKKIISTAEHITARSMRERIPLPKARGDLYRLTTTINSLLDRLEEAVQRERQFTADASHELRTPLAALRGTLDVLIRRPRSVEHYEEKIRHGIREVDRMATLVEQLLALARYDSGAVSPSFEEVNLCESVDEAAARLSPLMEERHIVLASNGVRNCTVRADARMTESIIENILSNAVKYSHDRGSITISVIPQEGRVRCTIQDNGMGIDPDALARVFDRFYRVDGSRSSATSGTGLGLAIVKRLADIQGLTVSINSEPQVGTTVNVDFPSLRVEGTTVAEDRGIS